MTPPRELANADRVDGRLSGVLPSRHAELTSRLTRAYRDVAAALRRHREDGGAGELVGLQVGECLIGGFERVGGDGYLEAEALG